MEEDKKRKKNKKKKNKQASKPTESVTIAAKESTSESKGHILDVEQNSNGQVSGIIDSSNYVGGHIDVDTGGNHANVSEGTNLTEAEKQYWLDREASFQEKVKELEAEKNAQIQRESLLEERIKQFLKEKDENAQQEASEREKIKKLQDDKDASMQNEALLEESVKQLLKEKDDHAQKEVSETEEIKQLYDEKNALMLNEASLKEKLIQLEKEKEALSHNEGIIEQKILQLQKEVELHLQKEVGFEDKINQLVDEAAFLNLTGVKLQEKIKQMEKERDFLILKENSAKESVASLTNENSKLRAQVIELEQSRKSLLEEKQQMSETVSSLQLRINNLESAAGSHHSSADNKVTSEDGEANYQIEAAGALVERLIMENSELVEKVNELYAELNQRGLRAEQFSSAGSVPEAVTNQSADSSGLVPDLTIGVDGSHSTCPISEASSAHYLENAIVEDQRNGELVKINDGRDFANSSEIIEADEIVQISLDESGIKENNLGVRQDDENTDVLLTDAPLIGAPFRLISFVARYVSGADLVDKNTGTSG